MYNKHGKKRQFVPILNINDLKKGYSGENQAS